MYLMEKAFWNLLKGNIFYNGEKVKIIKRLKSRDQTPCITLEQASEIQMNRDYRTDTTQRIVLTNNVELWVNIWCDTEEERHEILSQIKSLFFKALSNHYTTCTNYNKETQECNNTNSQCGALTITNGRTAKQQCPDIKKYGYCSWFNKNHIVKNSFKISGISDMDQLDIAQPILRTLIKFDMNYIISYNMGGKVPNDLIFNEDLL